MFSFCLLTCLVSNNSHILLTGDVGKLVDVCARKTKHIRSKKNTVSEKRKLIIEKKTPSPEHAVLPKPEIGVSAEHETVVVKPVAPKKSRSRKKKESQREKGIVIREDTPKAARFPLVPAGDKGKEVMREPSRPAKRQKTIPLTELR